MVFILDSYIVESVDGPQKEWLIALLDGPFGNMKHKFGVYHAPLYPSSRDFNSWLPEIERQTWSPIFERYGFKVNFEHHDHTLKQTFPLVGLTVNDTHGVTYLGDGSFGVDPRQPNSANDDLFVIREKVMHVWQVIITPGQTSYTAVDDTGKMLLNISLSP